MKSDPVAPAVESETHSDYHLNDQIGYMLRLSNQKHLEIFSEHLPWLTPTQFSVMVRLREVGDLSQNELGRQVGVDAATINGVVDRLIRKRYLESNLDPRDKRRLRISLSDEGHSALQLALPLAKRITQITLEPLKASESAQLLRLLNKLATA